MAQHFAVFLADALVTSIANKPVLFVLDPWTKKTPLASSRREFVPALDYLSLRR